MSELLLTLGTLSLGGGAAVGVLALLSRAAWSRYGARWRCWIWLLLCLRLAVPLSLPVQDRGGVQPPIQLPAPTNPVIFDSRPQGGTPGGGAAGQPAETGPAGEQSPAASSSPKTPSRPAAPSPKGGVRLSLAQVLTWVWLAGAAAVLLRYLWQHLGFLRYLRRWASPITQPEVVAAFNQLGDQLGLDRRPRLMACQGLRAPMLAGLLRPVLLLPRGRTSGETLGCALLHELIHYRRRDIWLKALALWTCAVHWFNPLMWYMIRLVEQDTELACDEAVLRSIPASDYAAYGRAILSAVETDGQEKGEPGHE